MFEIASAARSFVSQPGQRLPLARTRLTADRGGSRDRPAASAEYPRIASTDSLHREAFRLAAREAQCRLVQAQLIAAFMKRRLWRPLGFVRLPDYAAERLGLRARSLQEDARVATALDLLPTIRRALETGAIRWTHARLLAGVATPAFEDRWLRLALASTTRQLGALVKAARNGEARADEEQVASLPGHAGETSRTDAGPDACASRKAFAGPDACASRGAAAGPEACTTCASAADPDACASPGFAAGAVPDDSETADPPLVWSIVVTRAGRRLWRVVGDLASRMCGADVPASRVAEAVAAEAMSWNVWEPPVAGPITERPRQERARDPEDVAGADAPPHRLERNPDLDRLLLHLDHADAHEIDRRLRGVRSTMQQIDAELGAVLRKAFEQNVPRRLGFADLRHYAESRLGICGSKAMSLVRLDRQCAMRSPALLRAYREGRVTWLAATALLPVISLHHEDAWVRRAGQVTLRRLEAEVSWALDRADDIGGNPKQAPPPLDLDVTADAFARFSPADIQMRAHPQTDLGSFSRRVDARIGIAMPASIAALLDDAIEGCRHAIEPRWRGFERILAHAWLTWTALPQHENAVYARDSHRCQVPGCRSRAPLHAHHVWFRSKGGPDASWNLTSVCDEHHRAIHRGEIRVHGRAPDRLVWELGCRPGLRPLLRLRGEVYWAGDTPDLAESIGTGDTARQRARRRKADSRDGACTATCPRSLDSAHPVAETTRPSEERT